jgi:hypothetical protein
MRPAFPMVKNNVQREFNHVSSVVNSDGERMAVTSSVCMDFLEGLTSIARQYTSPCPSAGLIRLRNRIGDDSRISLLDCLCFNYIREAIHPSTLSKLNPTK